MAITILKYSMLGDIFWVQAVHTTVHILSASRPDVSASRPYVMQEVGHVARFQATPKVTHAMEVKRIFRYLKGTIAFRLWYPKENEMTIVTYTYENWSGNIDDRRSTSGAIFYLGDFLVSWLAQNNL
jgi:hypothetical protein